MKDWEFVGWGTSRNISDLKVAKVETPQHTQLGQWKASAICGNDITSSCLYVSALSILAAGVYAPLALLIVAAILYLFRKIYGEVGSALPLNGGTYTLLLNTTNKKYAAIAACLTLLSYIATAVISANEAMHYLHHILPTTPVILATVLLLGIFAFLNIIGISESANVALGIFIFHLTSLTALAAACIYYIYMHPEGLIENWNQRSMVTPSPGKALYYGFAAAMLGISGFESSANFIEEQEVGVFPKTLRNMWMAVSIFNPLLCFLALGIINTQNIGQYSTSLLSHMAEVSAGDILKLIISIDAVLVLSGAVLTSYVGVIGLVRRMSLDRCLPQILLRENNWKHTNHWIILSFFILCSLILFATQGDVERLAGVYTLSFLCVMALFAIGNLLLKVKRSRLPREERASTFFVMVALCGIFVGLSGNLSVSNLMIFLEFLSIVLGVVLVMLYRIQILRIVLSGLDTILSAIKDYASNVVKTVDSTIGRINSQEMIFFTKEDDLPTLNAAALYVLENELTASLTVVYVYKKGSSIPPILAEHLKTIDHVYPSLKINFLTVEGEFGPELIESLSQRLNIPKNFMFIGTPSENFAHRIADLGGVRLILG